MAHKKLTLRVVFNLRVIMHFSGGRERYLAFVRNPFVTDSDVVYVFSGNNATQEEFIAPKTTPRGRDDLFSFCASIDFGWKIG